MAKRSSSTPDDPVEVIPEECEELSRQVARFLFERHPEWRRYAGRYTMAVDGKELRLLEVRIPSEHPRIGTPLLVQVEPSGVYLEWDRWHDHVFRWMEDSQNEFLQQVVEKVENWISDRYLFASVYEGDRLALEWGSFAGDEHPDHLVSRPGERTVIRSWRGSHDREFQGD